MSQLNTKKVKFGDNQDLSKNFIMGVPAVADGTFSLKREDGTVVWEIPAAGGGGTAATVNGLTVAGNLDFSGASRRITGDFSDATVANRLMFQNSVVNAITEVGFLPNGAGTMSQLNMYGSIDTINHSVMRIGCNSAAGFCNINSGAAGTGPILPMIFQTGGIERLRIDTTGNVQLGLNAVAANNFRYFDVYNTDAAAGSGSTIRLITQQAGSAAITTADFTKFKNGGLAIANYEPGSNSVIAFSTQGVERARFEADGGLLLRPVSTEGGELRIANKAGGVAIIIDGDSSDNLRFINASSTAGIVFHTNGNQRFFIAANGTGIYSGVFMGGEFRCPTTGFAVNTDSWQLPSASGSRAFALAVAGNQIAFYCAGNLVGSIFTNTTNTTYNTSSDYRLKKNIRAMVAPLARLLRLKPVAFDWRFDDSEGEGFIAHELQEEYPAAVSGEKDAVETREDMPTKLGDILPQGVDHSKLVPLLVAAVQELAQEVAALKAQLQGA